MNREEFFRSLIPHLSASDLAIVQCAYWFSKESHRHAKRDTGERYFEHPRAVALILVEHGIYDVDSLVLALIHDAVEDGFAPSGVIISLFSTLVYQDLLVLSKTVPAYNELTGEIIGWAKRENEEYFETMSSSHERIIKVKFADRLHNLRSISFDWPKNRLRKQLKETRKFILPLAKRVDMRFYREILTEVNRLEIQVNS